MFKIERLKQVFEPLKQVHYLLFYEICSNKNKAHGLKLP
jgi:hypothetical protein